MSFPWAGQGVTYAFLPSRQTMDGSFIQHSVRVLQELNKQREKGQYCDATLDVGGLVFKAHWSVLACCSHFFQSLYGDGSGGSVVLPAGFAEIFGLLLDFFYTGHLALTSGNRDQVLLAARELRVPEAVELCQSFKPKASVGPAPGGQSAPGKPVPRDVNSHLKELAGLEGEEVSRTVGQVPRGPELSGSHSPQRPQLGLPAQVESPSFLRGKLKQALKLCAPEDKEPEDCKVPPRPFEAEGAQLQGRSNEVLCPGCWEWGGGRRGKTATLFWHEPDPRVERVLCGFEIGFRQTEETGSVLQPQADFLRVSAVGSCQLLGVEWAAAGLGVPQSSEVQPDFQFLADSHWPQCGIPKRLPWDPAGNRTDTGTRLGRAGLGPRDGPGWRWLPRRSPQQPC